MKLLLSIILTSIVLIGCTSSNKVISSENINSGWLSQFNEDAKDRKATILFRDTVIPDAQQVQARIDSISFFLPKYQTRYIVPIKLIKKITFTNPTRGLFEGVGIGLLSGGVTGLLNAYISYPDPRDLQALAYLFEPIIFGGVGMVIGGTIGVIREHKYEYEFTNSSERN